MKSRKNNLIRWSLFFLRTQYAARVDLLPILHRTTPQDVLNETLIFSLLLQKKTAKLVE